MLSLTFHVGDVVQKLRKAHRLNLAKCARLADVDKQTLWRLESRGHSFKADTLERVASVFHARALDLLCATETLSIAAQQISVGAFAATGTDGRRVTVAGPSYGTSPEINPPRPFSDHDIDSRAIQAAFEAAKAIYRQIPARLGAEKTRRDLPSQPPSGDHAGTRDRARVSSRRRGR